ncbi:hypothetical protein ACE2AK_23425 [Rahnella perminowiae]|uniref:Lipoprotein n=1 Tax=Rahnella perminowiae TaxID=2816244 RepID=A0ABS6L3Q9_9GAMM|nr:hypothetical protein [Rahnella perminowiae]MBU9811408.1 hypothetical protein [Rahnella perminowiae]MBU9836481.1 hypothetical protein [Rahnella perminowiae]UJD92199.1 hypothetical protein FS594_26040 [Rahnella aquatilis]
MKSTSKLLIGLVCVMALSGCARTEPVSTPHTTLVTHNSESQIRTAIIDAGQKRGWIMTDGAPGVINGHLNNREHKADIRITYNTSGYTINYVGSTNLLAEKGEIHRSYNHWVNNLDNDIQIRLASSATK